MNLSNIQDFIEMYYHTNDVNFTNLDITFNALSTLEEDIKLTLNKYNKSTQLAESLANILLLTKELKRLLM